MHNYITYTYKWHNQIHTLLATFELIVVFFFFSFSLFSLGYSLILSDNICQGRYLFLFMISRRTYHDSPRSGFLSSPGLKGLKKKKVTEMSGQIWRICPLVPFFFFFFLSFLRCTFSLKRSNQHNHTSKMKMIRHYFLLSRFSDLKGKTKADINIITSA